MKKLYRDWEKNLLICTEKNALSHLTQKILIIFILILCFFLRIYSIDVPKLDRTAWKEIDYIEISKNYWQHGYKFHQPEISWPAEPPRVTAMELPLVPYVSSLLYSIFGFNVYSVRIITLISFLILSLYIFLLARRELGVLAGLFSSFAATIMPLYHPSGRALFSEPFMITLAVVSVYHFAQYIDFQRNRDWFISMAAFSLAVALKLTPLYLLMPFIWIAFRKYRFHIHKYKGIVIFIAVSLILPLIWYAYAYYLAKSSIDVFGIFHGHDKLQTIDMLTSLTWYKIMFWRIVRLILGGIIGTLLCMIGFISLLIIRKGGLIFSYLFAICCFFAIVAEGQIDAPYRQLTAIPPLAIFVGFGTLAVGTLIITAMCKIKILNYHGDTHIRLVLICGIILISTLLVFNHEKILQNDGSRPKSLSTWEFALEIKKVANPEDKLITIGEYTIHKGGNDLSPVLYYYSGLTGWSLQKEDWEITRIHELIRKGATILTARKISRESELITFIKELRSCYKILYEDKEKDRLILDLNKPKF